MNTLSNELKTVIGRRLEQAGPREILAIASALCTSEVAEPKVAPAGDRYEVVGDTVTDRTTGLTWTRGNVSDKRLDFKGAEKACADLELDGGGWRLPTIRELLTLVDYDRHEPTIDPVFECEPSWYWTSTPYAPSPGDYAWFVLFSYGGAAYGGRGGSGFVRAIRGGQY